MRSTFYLSALSALLATSAFAQDFQGTWQGYRHLDWVDRPYLLSITKDAQNHWAATVIVDNDWGNVFQASSIAIDGRKLTLALGRSSYDAQLSEDGNALDGTWTAGAPSPLRLERSTPQTQWHETAHKTQFVTVDSNVKLEVLDWGGTGPALVMLPGGDLTAHLFSQFAAALTPHYHVYGITLRGFGASTAPPIPAPPYSIIPPDTYLLKPLANNPYDADRLGDDIVKVLDALHLEHPVLVGHSIAGEVLTSVASRYPGRAAGLIYLDAFAEFAFSDGQRYDALFTNEHPMRMTLPLGQTPHLRPDDAVLLGMHEYRHFPNLPALAIFTLPHHIQGLTGQALADFNASQQRALDRMNRIRPLLPTVHIVNLPNADHMVWESNAADVLREMNAFMATLPR